MPTPSSTVVRCNKRKASLLSASTIAAATARASHLLKIDGYSSTSRATPNGRCIYSHPFKVGGYTWRIRYYPNGRDKHSADHVSLFLALEQSVDDAVQVQYALRFVDDDEDEAAPLESSKVARFKNVTFILELAEQHQCLALKNACFQFLSTSAHLQAALATDSFKHMSRNCPSLMMELVAKLGTQAQ